MIRLVLALLLFAGAARAEEGDVLSGTLQTIRERGTILIGVREDAVPLSFRNQAGQPIGFAVDICRGIAADVARVLNAPLLEPGAPAWETGIRLTFVPVSAEARLPKVIAGEIDLECGSTTANAERARTVAFSPITFLAGTKLMVPADGPQDYIALGGRTVAVSAGTTNADVLRRLATRMQTPLKVVETPSTETAFSALVAGTVDAFASDDILLAGLLATHPERDRFRVVGEYLSYEPYAIMFRRDDPVLANLVRASFERQAREGTLRSSYLRWFTTPLFRGENLNLPMSPQLAELFRALGEPD